MQLISRVTRKYLSRTASHTVHCRQPPHSLIIVAANTNTKIRVATTVLRLPRILP
jgi:hypothetical protein